MIQGRHLSNDNFQVNALDGLRGLAVLMVFVSHTSFLGMSLFPSADFSGLGKTGVYLFFVLSSFLLTLPFIIKGRSAINEDFLLNYYIRRFIRIFPLYFLYLLMGLIIGTIVSKAIGSDRPIYFPFNLSLTNLFGQLATLRGEGITWSIAVEFQYYFILPLLAVTYSAGLSNRLVPSIILTFLLILTCQVLWPQYETLTNDIRLRQHLPVFFMGSFLAVVHVHWQSSELRQNKKIKLILEMSGIASIVAVILFIPSISAIILGGPPPFHFQKQIVLIGFLWSTVLFAVMNGYGWLRKLCEVSFLRYCGFISFSIYLWHFMIIEAVRKFAPELAFRGWVVLVVTIAFSHLTWVAIERPTSKIRLDSRKEAH